jgi:hypothetical protein
MPSTTTDYETAERARLAHMYAVMCRRRNGEALKPALFHIIATAEDEFVVRREQRTVFGDFRFEDVELDLKEAFDDIAHGWRLATDVQVLDGLFTYEQAMVQVKAQPTLKAIPYFEKAISH